MKKLFKIIPLILVPFLSITSLASISAELPARGPIPFASYDSDENGFISEQEFNQVRAERMVAKAAQGFAMKRAGNAPLFSAFDKDLDGQLTEQELTAGQRTNMKNRGGKSQGSSMGSGRRKGAGMSKGRNMPSFSEFDLNGDGVVLKQEFYDARAARIKARVEQGYPMRNIANASTFADIDIDGNGKILSEEFAEYQVNHRKKMMQK